MAKRTLHTYELKYHYRGHTGSKGVAFITATTAEFAGKQLRRAKPQVVIDKTKLRPNAPIFPR